MKVDLGCGTNKVKGCLGVDYRRCKGVDIVADARFVPLRSSTMDEVYCMQLVEHFSNPYWVIKEMYRILAKEGTVTLEVPNYGTASAALDPSHKFVGDLLVWRTILSGFFRNVKTYPIGVRFRSVSEKWKKWQEQLIYDGLWDFAQGFKFECTGKKNPIAYKYVPWFLEEEIEEMKKEVIK